MHPLQRYAAARAAPAQEYQPAPPFADSDHEPDPSRYDEALYGQLESAGPPQHDPAYPDDPYYQDGYDDGAEERVEKRRGGMVTVVVVLALAVLGTGAAFAYRTYVGSPRSGEPPVIKADTSPIKIVPAPSDGSGKVPDRMNAGDGTEKIVPREEAPVDVNAKAGPRVVFPPLNQNGNPPPMASIGAAPPPATGSNGTLPNNEPRKIKTFSVRGEQPDGAATPVTAAPPPAPAAKPRRRRGAAAHPAGGGQRQCIKRQCAAVAVTASRSSGARRGTANQGRRQQPGADRAAGSARWRGRRRRVPGSGRLAAQRGRRPGLVSGSAGQVPGRAGIAHAGDQARRSRRQGRLLPRHGRPVRVDRRSGAVLRQPENRRRAVRRPKELTAVSLTLVDPWARSGLIGPT